LAACSSSGIVAPPASGRRRRLCRDDRRALTESPKMIRSALINVMTAAALKAGRGLKRDFGEVENLQVSMKGPGDFVSVADRKAEKVVFEELSKARPGYGFVLEEGGTVEGNDKSHTWYVDPLDGTTNFLHSLPIFAVSIALEREGSRVAGIVYNPATDDLFVAEKGQGAYHNNRRLRVAARTEFADALVGCGIPPLGRAKNHTQFKAEFSAVMARAGNVRRLGSAALDLAFVAGGRLDAFWERSLHSWDMAAGIVLIREAGGFVSDAEGGEAMLADGSICAGNETMHRQLLALLRAA
jgi:myo-inositol-1(or 4)-monophosphatase